MYMSGVSNHTVVKSKTMEIPCMRSCKVVWTVRGAGAVRDMVE
jgi:hypothetical protein